MAQQYRYANLSHTQGSLQWSHGIIWNLPDKDIIGMKIMLTFMTLNH